MHDTIPEHDQPTTRAARKQPGAGSPVHHSRRWLILLCIVAVAAATMWGISEIRIARPVRVALAADSRHEGFALRAHYRRYMPSSTLVLDLTRVQSVAPVDLFRGLFESACALATVGRRFHRVILERSGEPVFLLSGEDFRTLGEEYGAGQNPIFLIRTLPEKLAKPEGTEAYASWTGGWLGVMTQQMNDANDAAESWMDGATPKS